jgi:hypothetical protein
MYFFFAILLFGTAFSLGILASPVTRRRPLLRWTEPFPGDVWFVDGRAVTVKCCTDDGVKVAVNSATITIPFRYWRRRARIGAQEPSKLLELHAGGR